MILILIIVYLIPFLFGTIITGGDEGTFNSNLVYRHFVGFFSELGIWGIIALPVTLFEADFVSFHILCRFFLGMMATFSIVSLYITIKRMHRADGAFSFRFSFCRLNAVSRVMLVGFLVLFAFQMIRSVYGVWAEYQDNTLYLPEIVETLESDSLEILVRDGPKRILAPWFSFLSMLTYFSGEAPLHTCETIIPMFILLLFYEAAYIIGKYFFRDDSTRVVAMMTATAVITAVFEKSIYGTYIYTTHPVIWGKCILGATAFPVMIVIFQSALRKKINIRTMILLFLFGAGCAWLSATSILVIPLGVFLAMIFDVVKMRRVRAVWCAAVLAGASIMQFVIYMLMFSGEPV